MPELPEVETMRRGIASAVGSTIHNVYRPASSLRSITIEPRLDRFRRRAVGQTITAIDRVGKRIVLALGGGDRVVFEPRMTGLVMLADPPDTGHLRLVIECDSTSRAAARQILFWDQRGLGIARCLSTQAFHDLYGPDRLGPDALEITPQNLRQRLEGSRRAIKVALLDQRALAGVGNLYASEILHRVGIHPATPCDRLSPSQWRKLHAAMNEVLLEAILHQGSTLRDGTYRIARNEPGNFQFCHRVYQRTGDPCLACGKAEIVRIVQAQRSTFFCPSCQSLRS